MLSKANGEQWNAAFLMAFVFNKRSTQRNYRKPIKALNSSGAVDWGETKACWKCCIAIRRRSLPLRENKDTMRTVRQLYTKLHLSYLRNKATHLCLLNNTHGYSEVYGDTEMTHKDQSCHYFSNLSDGEHVCVTNSLVFIKRTLLVKCNCQLGTLPWRRIFMNRDLRWRRINKWWWKVKVHSEDQSSQMLTEVCEWILSSKTQQTWCFRYFWRHTPKSHTSGAHAEVDTHLDGTYAHPDMHSKSV